MKPPNHHNCQSKRNTNAAAESDAIDSFRGWLQTAITDGQYDQNGRPPRQPRSKTPNYCRSLANVPDNALARELAAPVLAVLDQIEYAAAIFQRAVTDRTASGGPAFESPVAPITPEQEAYKKVLWQLDLALALTLRRLATIAGSRAQQSACPDLLCEVALQLSDAGPPGLVSTIDSFSPGRETVAPAHSE
jgi:hypothetical protein